MKNHSYQASKSAVRLFLRLNLTQSSILMWRFRCSCRHSFLNSLFMAYWATGLSSGCERKLTAVAYYHYNLHTANWQNFQNIHRRVLFILFLIFFLYLCNMLLQFLLHIHWYLSYPSSSETKQLTFLSSFSILKNCKNDSFYWHFERWLSIQLLLLLLLFLFFWL